MKKLVGKQAQDFLLKQLADAENGLAGTLAPYEPEVTFNNYFVTFRAIEELINLPLFELNDLSLERDLVAVRLDYLDADHLKRVRDGLLKYLNKEVVSRLVTLIVQTSAMFAAFSINGMHEAAVGLQSVEHAIGYFQSRRRHLLAILYSIPRACKGSAKLAPIDTLNDFLPLVEYAGVPITTNYNRLMLSQLYPDFHVLVSATGYTCNHFYNVLDSSFLEPERAGLTEMAEVMKDRTFKKTLEKKPRGKLFSAAELRNDICVISAAYAEFNLAEIDTFASMANFVTDCSHFCEDDYYIRLPANQFDELTLSNSLSQLMKKALIQEGDNYVANLDTYAPFIKLGERYVTTVTLLSRFMHRWKILVLNRVRRFQIRSGFILEGSVKEALTDQGFRVADIKRINGSEFDVVAIIDDVVYNVQCKNNFIDYSRIESNPKLFIRYNRRLERYYAQALIKEEAREELLKEKLQLSKVVHLVVSRFPIATTNPRVISFSDIKRIRSGADEIRQDS
jgi:hypothetical protein